MSRFRSDCSNCCGLCCIVPAYLRDQGFPRDKPAHVPCRHLDRNARCGIHAERVAHGFGACCGFDCHGAGQWITQVLFAGARRRIDSLLDAGAAAGGAADDPLTLQRASIALIRSLLRSGTRSD